MTSGMTDHHRGETADLERELTRFMRRSRANSAAIAAEVHPKLDVASYIVLVTIAELEESLDQGVRAADVAERLGLHKSTMSRTITVLERLRLVTREPSATDARARILAITPSGHESYRAAIGARRERMAGILQRWSAADVGQLARLLAQLNDDFS
ncbi:MAG: MarR family transcriptional regulator [Actinomycetota bacterium]|nr:MarR family transcriptional regulator [Actinomycetota bacterium]